VPELKLARVVRFGVFEVNFHAHELRKQGTRLRLPGQPFAILAMLLERPGEVVTRKEMRDRLWASDTFVDFEHGLNSAIKKLRRALGDSSENPRYIETIPRAGYRFIASLEEIAARENGVPEVRSVPKSSPRILPLGAQRKPSISCRLLTGSIRTPS
jgi:DNA-binding winged helix-turn-helix (wHTH) protein